MRRILVTLLALSCLLGLPSLAAAQPGPFGPLGPGGVIQQSTSSGTNAVPINNTPASGSADTLLTTVLNSSAFSSQYPLHFIAHGRFSTSGGATGTMQFSMTIGSGSALNFPSSALTMTAGLSSIPFTVDCTAMPYAINTASSPRVALTCKWEWVESQGTPKKAENTSLVTYNGTGQSQLPPTFNAVWKVTFSLSTAGNGLIVDDWRWAVN